MSNFLKPEEVMVGKKELNPKSIYDLKISIKDEDLAIVVKFLLKKLMTCDIDPEIYFKFNIIKSQEDLLGEVKRLLGPKNSRKYDIHARYILIVLEFILEDVSQKR